MLGFHVNDRSRTSRGAVSETIEVAFKICIEFTCKSEFAEREALFKSELARVVSVFNQKVGDLANENILRQQSAMSDKIIQLEVAAEIPVQSEAAAARSALYNAQQKMSQENTGRVFDFYRQT